ncbi:MAG: ABC transporter permease [Ruminococcaceae bacterium]|nr:ABC transporter permease [Oscillospiraceae bacterium]
MIQYFQTPSHKRRFSRVMWITGAVSLFLALLFLAALGGIRSLYTALPGTDAAERWQAEDSAHPFTQLAVYFDSASAIDLNTVYLRRMEITKKLEENAITAPHGASPYIDAFSGETALSVSTERATIYTEATVCGGDFFFFHPQEMIHGSYFSEDDLTAHAVILDEYAAWQLFGASEVTGMDVTIGGQLFRIAGVCKKPTGVPDSITWGETPRIFVNYLGLRMTTGFDRASAYEIVLPNPVENYAVDLLRTQFSVRESSTNAAVSEITTRFSFETLAKQSADFFLRAVRVDRILPPFWENNIRVAETKAIVIAFFASIAGILSLLGAVSFVSLWFWIHPIRIMSVYEFFNDKYEARRMKKWLKKQASPWNAPEKQRS